MSDPGGLGYGQIDRNSDQKAVCDDFRSGLTGMSMPWDLQSGYRLLRAILLLSRDRGRTSKVLTRLKERRVVETCNAERYDVAGARAA